MSWYNVNQLDVFLRYFFFYSTVNLSKHHPYICLDYYLFDIRSNLWLLYHENVYSWAIISSFLESATSHYNGKDILTNRLARSVKTIFISKRNEYVIE
jgi:hypothetical protein